MCGEPIWGSGRCDDCWELKARIHAYPELARKILTEVEANMIQRFIGDCEIRLHYRGRSTDNRAKYCGYILLPDGQRYDFNDLQSGVGSSGTTAEDYDEMAESAINFASYYTTNNRGDDLPGWAPSADLADDISEAACSGMKEEGGYEVRREQHEKG